MDIADSVESFMKIVIMAGGKGTRIASVNANVPKPMICICDKPILQHQIECVRRQGCTEIILVIGYLGKVIEEYFGDGNALDVHISYIREKEPLGTAGALFYLKNVVKDDFLLINGDVIFDIDIGRFYSAHMQNEGLATILTHPNSHPYDSGIIEANYNKEVTRWLSREDERGWYKNRVNAGLHMLSPKLLESFNRPEKKDLDRDILKPLISKRELYIYDSPEYIKDMGVPERYAEVISDMKSGIVSKRNLGNRQRAVFLDRDGTINQCVGHLKDIHDFVLIDGVAKAIRKINQSGYLVIVVTNQPVIARGELSLLELQEIHKKMETLLGREGAYIDDIFFCPHHPHKGYEGERPEYKIECDCRKPKPGMLMEAAEKYNIDLEQSWMIGDGENDMEAGKRAGCHVAYISRSGMEDVDSYPDLLTCINNIIYDLQW